MAAVKTTDKVVFNAVMTRVARESPYLAAPGRPFGPDREAKPVLPDVCFLRFPANRSERLPPRGSEMAHDGERRGNRHPAMVRTPRNGINLNSLQPIRRTMLYGMFTQWVRPNLIGNC